MLVLKPAGLGRAGGHPAGASGPLPSYRCGRGQVEAAVWMTTLQGRGLGKQGLGLKLEALGCPPSLGLRRGNEYLRAGGGRLLLSLVGLWILLSTALHVLTSKHQEGYINNRSKIRLFCSSHSLAATERRS